jgi:hypothetical protein
MGAIASQIASSSFNFQDEGENPNKMRLIRTYNNYVELAAKSAKEGGKKINIYDTISDEVIDDDKELGRVIASFGKTWPSKEAELTSQEGFFNSLTEE